MQYTVIFQERPFEPGAPPMGVWAIGDTESKALRSCVAAWRKLMARSKEGRPLELPGLSKIRAFDPLKGEEPFVSLADARWEDLDPRCVDAALPIRAGIYE